MFAGLVPFLIYQGCVAEFNHVDDQAQRPRRAMWGSSSSS